MVPPEVLLDPLSMPEHPVLQSGNMEVIHKSLELNCAGPLPQRNIQTLTFALCLVLQVIFQKRNSLVLSQHNFSTFFRKMLARSG